MKKFHVTKTDGGLIHINKDGNRHKPEATSMHTPLTVLQHCAELHELFQKAGIKPRWAHGFQFLMLGQLVVGRSKSIGNK